MKTVIALPDQHIPDHDTKSNRAVFRYIKERQPEEVILLGDLLDMDPISSYNKGLLRKIEGKRLQREFDAGNLYLDELQTVAPKAKVIYLEGNHEYRLKRWLDEWPQFEGVISIPRCLELEQRGIKWIPSWSKTQTYRIGKALFIHGLSHAKNHAEKMVGDFGANIFYGHLHDTNCHNKVTLGDNSTKIGQSLGCLCNYRQYYLQGRPTNWQQAFGEFHFRDDGFFNHYVVRIYNHKFVAPTGEIYG